MAHKHINQRVKDLETENKELKERLEAVEAAIAPEPEPEPENTDGDES